MKNLVAYAISNLGNVRDNHEDNLYIPKDNYIDAEKQAKIKTNAVMVEYEYSGDGGTFAVCDGMGGHNAGEVASRLAVETISKQYKEISTDEKEKLLTFIKKLNNNICEYSEKNPDCDNMGTTFSSVIFSNDKIHLLHVGDSRIYKYENSNLKQLSKDHTEGTRLVDAGILKVEDLPKMPNRKSLYKYLGRKGELIADCEQIEASDGSYIIISSDGLSDTVCDNEISEVLLKSSTPKEVCTSLIKKCLDKGSMCTDNVTIICIKIN